MATDTFDTGARVVTPALWALGVRRLTWLAFTHADQDHIGGAAAVAGVFHPREIWEGIPVRRDPRRAALEAEARRLGSAWREVRRGERLVVGGVQVDVLNPPVPDWERQRVRNDDSIVLRVRYGDAEMLLTGDIGRDTERDLPPEPGDPSRVRILKVAHHGSRTSSSASWLATYPPFAALVSVGRQNPFGHPAPDVVRRLEAAGARVFRTDRDGAIIVETDGHDVHLRTMSGGNWVVHVVPPPA
jgi:competence protein ComEC